MKKGLLILPLITLLLINFTSAGFIGDTFDLIGIDNILLVIIFLGSFTLSYIPLNKFFKNNGGIAGVLSFLVALGITAGINYTGFDISGLFLDLGIGEAILFPAVFLVLIIGIIIFIWKKGFGVFLMSLGALLFTLSWISYEDEIIRYAGVFLFIIGAFLWWRKKPKNSGDLNNSPKGTGFWTKKRELPEVLTKQRELIGSKKIKKWRQGKKLQKDYNKLKSEYSTAKNNKDWVAMKNIERAIKNISQQARGAGINLKY